MYVTIGTLLMIWSGLWYYYFLKPDPNPPAWQMFTCVGTIMSGVAIAVIGLLFGLIGRGAKGADNNVGVANAGPVTAVIPPGVMPAGVAMPVVAGTPMTAPTTQVVR